MAPAHVLKQIKQSQNQVLLESMQEHEKIAMRKIGDLGAGDNHCLQEYWDRLTITLNEIGKECGLVESSKEWQSHWNNERKKAKDVTEEYLRKFEKSGNRTPPAKPEKYFWDIAALFGIPGTGMPLPPEAGHRSMEQGAADLLNRRKIFEKETAAARQRWSSIQGTYNRKKKSTPNTRATPSLSTNRQPNQQGHTPHQSSVQLRAKQLEKQHISANKGAPSGFTPTASSMNKPQTLRPFDQLRKTVTEHMDAYISKMAEFEESVDDGMDWAALITSTVESAFTGTQNQ